MPDCFQYSISPREMQSVGKKRPARAPANWRLMYSSALMNRLIRSTENSKEMIFWKIIVFLLFFL